MTSRLAPVATVNGWVYADTDSGPYYTSNDAHVFGPASMVYCWGGGGPNSSGFIPNLNSLIGTNVAEVDLSAFPDL
jgi:hypothetical protein